MDRQYQLNQIVNKLTNADLHDYDIEVVEVAEDEIGTLSLLQSNEVGFDIESETPGFVYGDDNMDDRRKNKGFNKIFRFLERIDMDKILARIEGKLLSLNREEARKQGIFSVQKEQGESGEPVLEAVGENVKVPQPSIHSLLLVHGTFGNVDIGFGDLIVRGAEDMLSRLEGKYRKDIYCFEHMTASLSIERNTRDFYESLPRGEYDFDIITRSRGALLTRNIMRVERIKKYSDIIPEEYDYAIGKTINVHKIVMIAPVNQGTELAAKIKQLLDVLGRGMRFLSQTNPYLKPLAILMVVLAIIARMRREKQLLPGLWDMEPASLIIKNLMDSETKKYEKVPEIANSIAIIASQMSLGKFGTTVSDAIFKNKEHDGIVPTSMDTAYKLGFGDLSDGSIKKIPDGPFHTNYFQDRPSEEFEFVWRHLLGSPNASSLI